MKKLFYFILPFIPLSFSFYGEFKTSVIEEQEKISLLINKPMVIREATEGDNNVNNPINPQGGGIELSMRLVRSSSVIASTTSTGVGIISKSISGIIVTPAMEKYVVVNYYPSESLWPPYTEMQDVGLKSQQNWRV